jgi:hypothetical protein
VVSFTLELSLFVILIVGTGRKSWYIYEPFWKVKRNFQILYRESKASISFSLTNIRELHCSSRSVLQDTFIFRSHQECKLDVRECGKLLKCESKFLEVFMQNNSTVHFSDNETFPFEKEVQVLGRRMLRIVLKIH